MGRTGRSGGDRRRIVRGREIGGGRRGDTGELDVPKLVRLNFKASKTIVDDAAAFRPRALGVDAVVAAARLIHLPVGVLPPLSAADASIAELDHAAPGSFVHGAIGRWCSTSGLRDHVRAATREAHDAEYAPVNRRASPHYSNGTRTSRPVAFRRMVIFDHVVP